MWSFPFRIMTRVLSAFPPRLHMASRSSWPDRPSRTAAVASTPSPWVRWMCHPAIKLRIPGQVYLLMSSTEEEEVWFVYLVPFPSFDSLTEYVKVVNGWGALVWLMIWVLDRVVCTCEYNCWINFSFLVFSQYYLFHPSNGTDETFPGKPITEELFIRHLEEFVTYHKL